MNKIQEEIENKIKTEYRNGDFEKKMMISECCGARMIEGVQCETCGSNGKIEALDRELDEERQEEIRNGEIERLNNLTVEE